MRIDLNEDGKVYHYTTLETFLRYILPQRSLRLGRLSNTFDPDEQREISIGLSGQVAGDNESNDRTFELLDEFNKAAREVKKSFSRILCFTNSYDYLDQEFPSTGHAQKGWSQRPLWAHFADRHRGVSLEFDKALLTSSAKEALHRHGPSAIGDVIYMRSSRLPHRPFPVHTAGLAGLPTKSAAREYASTYFFGELFEKDQSWEYEQEFRIASMSPCPNELFIPVSDALTKIIIGSGADSSSIDSVRLALAVAGWDHIPVDTVAWDPMPMLVPLADATNLRGRIATPLYLDPPSCQLIVEDEGKAVSSTPGQVPLSCPGAFIWDHIPRELTRDAAYYRAHIIADMNRDAAEDALRAAITGNKLSVTAAQFSSQDRNLYAQEFPEQFSYLFPIQLIRFASIETGVGANVYLGAAESENKESSHASWKVVSDSGDLDRENSIQISTHSSDQEILDYQRSLIDWLNGVLVDIRNM